MARTRAIDVVLVQALDRWGRSAQDLIPTMAELETLGVVFVVPGHIDMSTPMGRMMAHLLLVVAEFERELILERVRSGLANARAKGKRLGRPCASERQVEVDKGFSLIKQGVTHQAAAKAIRGKHFHVAACPQKNTGRLTVENQAGEPAPGMVHSPINSSGKRDAGTQLADIIPLLCLDVTSGEDLGDLGEYE